LKADATSDEWRRNWPILLGSALGAGAGISLYANISGLFIKPLAASLHWSRGEISLGATAGLLTSFALPWVGAMVDRRGPRPFVLAGSVLFATAYLMLASMPGPYWVFLATMVFIGLGAGPATAPLVFTRPMVSAFHRSRGLALAIGISGNVFLAIVILPLVQHVIATFGWRAGYAAMAPVALVLGLASFWFLGRGPATTVSGVGRPLAASAAGAAGLAFREVLRDLRFWLLGLAMVSISLTVAAFASQLQPQLSDLGMPGPIAALLGAWYSGMVVVGRLICGALLDRLWPPGVAFTALLLPVVGMGLFLSHAPPFWLLACAATLVALSQGADADVLAFFAARYFGLRSVGVVMGVLGLACGTALALGATLSGFSFDRTGSYHLMLKVAAGLSALSAVCLLTSGLLEGRRFPTPSAIAVEETATEISI